MDTGSNSAHAAGPFVPPQTRVIAPHCVIKVSNRTLSCAASLGETRATPMAETSNISRMAEKIFVEMFEVYGWVRVGPAETNWPCVHPELHGNRTHHPTDVVFKYDDPYSDRTVYVIVDLKSYNRESITPMVLKRGIVNLCQTVACAHYGEGWRAKYQVDGPHELVGLLFVFNHSLDYANPDLRSSLLKDPIFDDPQLPPRQRAAFLGPLDIVELYAISCDIRALRGSDSATRLSPARKCFFWHPELVLSRLQESSPPAAPLEMLTSERIILQSENPKTHRPHYTIWYRESGATTDEFQYLIDSILRYQMLADAKTTVDIRLTQPDANAPINFEKAKQLYAERMYSMPQERLDRQISFNVVPNIIRRFNELEMGYRGA